MVRRLHVTALLNCDVPDDLGLGVEVGLGLRVTNNRDRINALITEHFSRMIGVLEVEALQAAPAVVFQIVRVPNDPTGADEIPDLNRFMRHVRMLLMFMWIAKDNAADCELAFAEVPHLANPSRVTSNFIAEATSDCRGGEGKVTFTGDELRAVGKMLSSTLAEVLDFEDPANPPVLDRVSRAMYLLQAARANHDVSLKVSFYIACLEALFSTTPAELAHKLSERVAYFISPTVEDRLEAFTRMKDSYAIRSAVMHGDAPSKKQVARLLGCAEFCDGAVRTTLTLLIRDSALAEVFKSAEQLEAYMKRLTLGQDTPPMMT